MRLSESLRRGILESGVGGIVNKFKFKKRRTVLFFEDILANYVKLCDDAGYGTSMRKIGEKWGLLGTKQLGTLSIFHSIKLLNYVARSVWLNVGLMDDCELTEKNGFLLIKTNNEFITRVIGKNEFMIGVYAGCLTSYFGKKVNLVKIKTDGKSAVNYTYKITEERYVLQCKDKELYNRLNESRRKEGVTLKKALVSRTVTLKENNRICYRNRTLIPIENTVFHIISNENIMMNAVSDISCAFFKEIIKKAPLEKKILLLKTLLQTTGWCTLNVVSKENNIIMSAENLPVGLQKEEDNWLFLVNVINGYMRTIDRRLYIKKILSKNRQRTIFFSRKKRVAAIKPKK